MTLKTIFLDDIGIERCDLNRFSKIAGSKGKAVVNAITSLSDVLADKVVRGMAAITGGNAFMRRAIPPIKLVPHDMTIFAC